MIYMHIDSAFVRRITKIGCITFFTALAGNLANAGSIAGSDHDFSESGWSGGDICIVCHTPFDTLEGNETPLWNHELSTKVYTLYNSPTMDATTAQPTASSKLCLSCHDGTVALDSFGGTTGTGEKLKGSEAVGADELNNDHPVSFVYNTALAVADGALHDPASTTVIIGVGDDSKRGSISSVMLLNGKVQCASCHDVHNKYTTDDSLLRVSTAGSALCLTCHDK